MDLHEACAIYKWTEEAFKSSSGTMDSFVDLMMDPSYLDALSMLKTYSWIIALTISIIAVLIIWYLRAYTKMNKLWLSITTLLLFGLLYIDTGNFYQISLGRGDWYWPLLLKVTGSSLTFFGAALVFCLIRIFINRNPSQTQK